MMLVYPIDHSRTRRASGDQTRQGTAMQIGMEALQLLVDGLDKLLAETFRRKERRALAAILTRDRTLARDERADAIGDRRRIRGVEEHAGGVAAIRSDRLARAAATQRQH